MLIKFIISVYLIVEISVSQKLSSNSLNSFDILPVNYSRDSPPILNGKPVEVDVAISLLSFIPDPNTDMSINVDLFYHLYWNDYRLVYDTNSLSKKLTLGSQWEKMLWIPDTYFRNAIKGEITNVMKPTLYFTVTNGTRIFMAVRIQMKLRCNMDFTKYPFDTQTCFINITTLSEGADSVHLNWLSFRVGNHVNLPEFDITDESIGVCTKYLNIGTYSCLYVVIHLSRNIGNFLVKRFVPSFITVIMTFIGFWIPTSAAPARVALIITALLALIAQQIQSELNVSYVYALEVWTIMCIIFVFATLIEYAIAISWPIDEKTLKQPNLFYGQKEVSKNWFAFIKVKGGPRNCSVDIVSRVLFPLFFGASVIVYCLVYCFI